MSVLPAGSVAATSNLCLPRFTFFAKSPASQAKSFPSSVQVNDEPGSFDVNANFAFLRFFFDLTCFFGFLVRLVLGAIVSGWTTAAPTRRRRCRGRSRRSGGPGPRRACR